MKNNWKMSEIVDHVKAECQKEVDNAFIKGLIVGAVAASVGIISGFLF
tara:strand:+ start:97 stop:240 length:144 start_codon:yes stop_codon:yes gene_type:complete